MQEDGRKLYYYVIEAVVFHVVKANYRNILRGKYVLLKIVKIYS
jgi:hypothetical protein